MLVLGIESSAAAASAAVIKDDRLLAESYVNIGLTHSQTLMPLVDEALNNAGVKIRDIDLMAVANGPGSFTGVRIGVSTLKGLAFADSKPVYGISTLEALAYGVCIPGVYICPVMDARCSQVYTALFRYENGYPSRLWDDVPLKLLELAEKLTALDMPVLLTGDGTAAAEPFLKESGVNVYSSPANCAFQRASGVAFCALKHYNEKEAPLDSASLLPSYLRLSQAERERKERQEKLS